MEPSSMAGGRPRSAPATNALDSRAAIHARLLSLVPGTERARFSRVLAALEAHHKNELHEQVRTSSEAVHRMGTVESDAGILQHAAAAKEAKLACSIEASRATLARRDEQLRERDAQCAALRKRAEVADARAHTSEVCLAAELRRTEAMHVESAKLLRELSLANEMKADHLGLLEQQSARSSALLMQMQEQAGAMQRRLGAQQRRTMRLQEQQSLVDAAARSWAQERRSLLQAAAAADEAGRSASARAAELEATLAGVQAEAAQERQASTQAFRHAREMSAAESSSLRSELRDLQALSDALHADGARVHMRSGGACTVAQYVTMLNERLQRTRRGGGGSSLGERPSTAGATQNQAAIRTINSLHEGHATGGSAHGGSRASLGGSTHGGSTHGGSRASLVSAR